MQAIDYWKLSDHYSIVQAAILACGSDPQELQYSVENTAKGRPTGYVPVRSAIYNAIRSGDLPTVVVEYERDEFGNEPVVDLHRTLIAVADLDAYFKARGMPCEIFDRSGLGVAGQLTGRRPQYPRKLDAAIKAWTAVTSDPSALRGKSPKQALEKWLLEHAGELSLLNRDGKPNRNGIEEIVSRPVV